MALSGAASESRRNQRIKDVLNGLADGYVAWLSELTETRYTRRQALYFSLFSIFVCLVLATAEFIPLLLLNVVLAFVFYALSLK